MAEKVTTRELIKKVLTESGVPMTATQIYNESKAMKIPWESVHEHPEAIINSFISKDVKGEKSEFMRTSSEPNTYAMNTPEIKDATPARETAKISDGPSAKKVVNLLQKINISKLSISNEHELELVMWGALCGRWPDWIKWRKNIGGRTCDVGLSGVAVEMKYIKTMADRDRLVGQVLDYLKEVDEVVVVAVDDKGLLRESPLNTFDNVFMMIV